MTEEQRGELHARLRQRIAEHRKGTEAEAIEWLARLVEEAGDRPPEEVEGALENAGLMTPSVLEGFEEAGSPAEDVMADIQSDVHRDPGFTELLRRLCDRNAEDALGSLPEAREACAQVAESVRAAERRRPKPSSTIVAPASRPVERKELQRRLALCGCGALVLILLFVIVAQVRTEIRFQREYHHPSATSSIAGTRVTLWPRERVEELRANTIWAYQTTTSSRADVANLASGPIDQYPNCDTRRSWYPEDDAHTEFLICRLRGPTEARAVVVVESQNPGAVIAVDDLVDDRDRRLGSGRIVRLWQGDSRPGASGLPAADGCRALVFHLPEPRTLYAVRVVLDSSRVPGLSYFDSIGILTGGSTAIPRIHGVAEAVAELHHGRARSVALAKRSAVGATYRNPRGSWVRSRDAASAAASACAPVPTRRDRSTGLTRSGPLPWRCSTTPTWPCARRGSWRSACSASTG